MAAVSNMMPVSLPRFTSASSTAASAVKQKQSEAGEKTGLATQTTSGENGTGDNLDFDLLAEYLLDDGAWAGGLPTFDFNSETPPVSGQPQQQAGVVSPDRAEQSFADPLADAATQIKQTGDTDAAPAPSGDVACDSAHQVQQIITTQATAVPQRINGAPAATFAAPAPPPAAAPSVPIPATPSTSSASFSAPIAAALAPVPRVNVQQNGIPQQPLLQNVVPDTIATSSKRRRIDAAAPVVAAATAAPVGTVMAMNGQILSQNFPHRGGRQKSQAQIDRRRERNRILARRTRLRKKFFFESLQQDVTDLQRENSGLKEIVRTRLSPEVAKSLLDECKATEELPDMVAEHCGMSSTQLDRQDFNLIQGIQKAQRCFVITDPSLQDNPVVYASDDFLSLTGYSRDEVLGRNCRFLQGTETSPAKVAQIRKAVASGEDCSVTLINYTADGTAFWNNLFIAALRDAQNNIVNFIGVIVKVAGPDSSDPEAGKRLPGEVSLGNGLDSQILGDPVGPGLTNGDVDAVAVAEAADGTVKAIEGIVTAALVTTPAGNASATATS